MSARQRDSRMQSENNSNKEDRLKDLLKIRSQVTGQTPKEEDVGFDGNVYQLLTKIGGLGEIIGREFEVRDPNGKLIYLIIQKPIKVAGLVTLFREAKKQDEREKAQAEEADSKAKRGKKR
jgi:hypothetical protein